MAGNIWEAGQHPKKRLVRRWSRLCLHFLPGCRKQFYKLALPIPLMINKFNEQHPSLTSRLERWNVTPPPSSSTHRANIFPEGSSMWLRGLCQLWPPSSLTGTQRKSASFTCEEMRHLELSNFAQVHVRK